MSAMLDSEQSIALTQSQLANEGKNLEDLLQYLRERISATLIGTSQWQRILSCARGLPIEMGAQPFGFEIPLNVPDPVADFGASLSSGTQSARAFEAQSRDETINPLARTVGRLSKAMQVEASMLRRVVGRKMMFEFDVSSPSFRMGTFSGVFLRPNEQPIFGNEDHTDLVRSITEALVACVGWDTNEQEMRNVERAYLAQPGDTRMDSFGVFPERNRSIRLAIMGFKKRQEVRTYLENAGWPGNISAVESVISRFQQRTSVERTGLNIDVLESGLGPTLGLTLIVKQRYTKESRYWLDGLTDWEPFLQALTEENGLVSGKIQALRPWVTQPSILYGKSGQFVLLQGIHHIKLVMNAEAMQSAKAYLFLVLAVAPQTDTSNKSGRATAYRGNSSP
ncbi:MAG: hypothetical protein F4039_01860 [Gammaproteobacteria bacterium]|nr:hypothetical protein [Gammaproteobacteria bacterium]MYK42820.1 hypothetical protein [Gammaproteobacteria bacterium]